MQALGRCWRSALSVSQGVRNISTSVGLQDLRDFLDIEDKETATNGTLHSEDGRPRPSADASGLKQHSLLWMCFSVRRLVAAAVQQAYTCLRLSRIHESAMPCHLPDASWP